MASQPAGKKPTPSKAAEQKNASQFVGFHLAGQEYAFRIEQIQEIVILDKVTRTPQVPAFVEGMANLRGAMIPIINLRRLFGLKAKAADGETRTIVVNVGERVMGCTVDSVTQVLRIHEDAIQPTPETIAGDGGEAISGFAKLDDRLVILLDIDELLDPERMGKRGRRGDDPTPG